MARLELEIGDARLDGLMVESYYQRQQGRVQQWQTKLAGLKALPKDPSALENLRVASDITTCEQELKRIEQEVALAQSGKLNGLTGKPYTPGDARQFYKQPSKKQNLPK